MIFSKSSTIVSLLTLYQTTNLDSSKLKEFADDSLKFDENGKKLSKRVENTVGKGEITKAQKLSILPTSSRYF